MDLAQWSRSDARRLIGLGGRDRGPVDFVRWLLRSIEDRYHVPEAVRDHLATCGPAALGDVVLRRRAELAVATDARPTAR